MGKNIEYFDDFNGQPLDAGSVDTVPFSYRGNDFSLDLTVDDGARFDAVMARYIKAAKKAQARDAQAAKKPLKSGRKSTAKPKKTAPAKATAAPTKAAVKAATKTPAAPTKAAVKATKAPAARAKAAVKAPAAPTKAAKTASRRKTSSPAAGAAATPEQNRRIREWAVANGRKVSLRGRISADVIDAYNAAN